MADFAIIISAGYFVHIHSVEEVQQQVLKYINVIARPMILEGENPLPTWTHANIDDTVLILISHQCLTKQNSDKNIFIAIVYKIITTTSTYFLLIIQFNSILT